VLHLNFQQSCILLLGGIGCCAAIIVLVLTICLFVFSFVPYVLLTWKHKGIEKTKIGVNVSQSSSNLYTSFHFKTLGLRLHSCTLWAIKNIALYFCQYLHRLLTSFLNFFSLAHSADSLQLDCYISHHMLNVFLHCLVKYKCKQKLMIITKILVNEKTLQTNVAMNDPYDT